MSYRLLLVDGRGAVVCPELRVRMLREFPGAARLSVHFRPVRNDLLFDSAKVGGDVAYRVLCGEDIVRSQLMVEYEVAGSQVNVMGRSAELLFALTLITAKWKRAAGEQVTIAATGTLAGDGAVGSVERTADKVAAATRDLSAGNDAARAIIFYPAEDAASVDAWRLNAAIPKHIELFAVSHLDDALERLGYRLEKVYLRNPFRGLEHFDYADHAVFFGRDTEVRQAVEQLLRREQADAPGLLVEGASGSGKSSFLRAGVLHALADPRFQSQAAQEALASRPISATVSRAIWRLGLSDASSDEQQIVAAIAGVWAQLPEFPADWQQPPIASFEDLAIRLHQRWPRSARFVWLIDQFEEILTQRSADPWIDAFGRFLKRLQSDGVWTLVSIRADATPLLKQHESLREVFGANEGQYYLATLSGTALDAIITLPARAADLTFEIGTDGAPLDQRLREDAYREKDSLPVLQFTLNELYLKRVGRQLTHAVYDALGGLSGSIATTAQTVLSSEGENSQAAAERLFRSLVSVDDSGRVARRYAPLADVAGDPAQRRLLERLIEARLCVTDQREGHAVVAFAHDTLLHTLPALTEWLQREAGILQTRELALRDARAWQQHDLSDDWLAGADKLALYQGLLAAQIVLPDFARDFIERSARRLRRSRRIRRAATAVIACLAAGVVIGAVVSALQARKAEQAADMAARRGEFVVNLLRSADPHGGKRDITVAELLDASARGMDRALGKEPLVEASMLGVITSTNTALGRYDQGFAASDRQLALLRANGASDLELARALVIRGELFRAHGLYAEATAPLQEAVTLLSARRGAEADLGSALGELGMALANTHHETEGEAAFRRAISIDQQRGPEGQLAAAVPMQNLAVLLGNQGRFQDALALVSQAVDLQRRGLPPDDPDILSTLGTYAAILADLHRPAEAELIQRDIVSRNARINGPDHTGTLIAQVQLGETLTDLHRYAEAVAILRPAAETLERNEGPKNRYTLGAWGDYIAAACLGEDATAGLESARKLAEIRKQTLPDSDWHQPLAQTYIGLCLVRLKRYAEAEPLLTAARARLESERGTKGYATQLNYQASQQLYAATGQAQEATLMASKLVP